MKAVQFSAIHAVNQVTWKTTQSKPDVYPGDSEEAKQKLAGPLRSTWGRFDEFATKLEQLDPESQGGRFAFIAHPSPVKGTEQARIRLVTGADYDYLNPTRQGLEQRIRVLYERVILSRVNVEIAIPDEDEHHRFAPKGIDFVA